MESGIRAGVPFEKACGGNAECLTCHIYLEEALNEDPNLIEPSEKELDALTFASAYKETSRLACQMKVQDIFEGKEFRFLNDLDD